MVITPDTDQFRNPARGRYLGKPEADTEPPQKTGQTHSPPMLSPPLSLYISLLMASRIRERADRRVLCTARPGTLPCLLTLHAYFSLNTTREVHPLSLSCAGASSVLGPVMALTSIPLT
jgi:hypothetical protein